MDVMDIVVRRKPQVVVLAAQEDAQQNLLVRIALGAEYPLAVAVATVAGYAAGGMTGGGLALTAGKFAMSASSAVVGAVGANFAGRYVAKKVAR